MIKKGGAKIDNILIQEDIDTLRLTTVYDNIITILKTKTNNEDNKEVTTTSSVSASLSSSVSTSIDISLLTVTNEMNRRLNEIEMKSTIQYQDLKLFYCTVSALQLIIILLLMKM
jgi:hypothetical protein